MLEIKNLSCGLNGTKLIQDLSFSIAPGQILCVVGPNGAGKSSLLRSILGILPISGEVKFHRRLISSYNSRELARKVAYLPQIYNDFSNFSVEQYLTTSRYAYRTPFQGLSAECRVVIEDSLQRTNSTVFRNRMMSQLSGGELQRVMFASTLSQNPELYLLDEPVSSLDPEHARDVMRLIMKEKEKGKSIVIVMHDLNWACLLSDLILALVNGKKKFYGSPQQLLEREKLNQIFGDSFELVEHPRDLGRMVLPCL
jgi:iron complex transport system ATP-binding protein